jgi:hypothetical protein
VIRSGTRVSLASALLATVLALVSATPASAQGKAKLTCKITENGESATGTVVLMAGDAEVARGSCAKGVTAPAGSYEAVLRLDGALDGPEQRKPVELAAGGSQSVQADFSTGLLEVKIQREGRRAAGMAIIRKGGKQIGTLGSGVAAHLSVGTYEVVARYRTQEKRFEAVTISRGQRVTLDAAFE